MGKLGVVLWLVASICAIAKYFPNVASAAHVTSGIRKWLERFADVAAVLAAIVSLFAYMQSDRQSKDRALTPEQREKLASGLRAFVSGGQHIALVAIDQREPVLFATMLRDALVSAGWRGVLIRDSALPRLLAGVAIDLVSPRNRSTEEVAAEKALSNELLELGVSSSVTTAGPDQAVLSPFVADGFPQFTEDSRAEDRVLSSTIIVTIAPKYVP